MFKHHQPMTPLNSSLNIPAEEFIESQVPSRTMQTSEADLRLARQIEYELSELGIIDLDAIEVTVREGLVTIQGTVDSEAEYILAGNTARSVVGVRALTNHLEVSHFA